MKGVTIGYIACKKELIGVLTLSDSCRIGSVEAIRELRSLGIKSVMLTGDSAAAAAYAQSQVCAGVVTVSLSSLFRGNGHF
jgi:Zn2+/Cd2+-exporting ATPase